MAQIIWSWQCCRLLVGNIAITELGNFKQKIFGGNAIGNVAKQKSAALSRADDSGHYYCYCPFQYVMQLSKYIRHSSLKYENRFKTLVHLALGWAMNLMKINYHFIQLSLKNI